MRPIVETVDGCVAGPAEARRAPDHRIQDRLEIGGRGADDPQDVGGGRLLLECLGEIAVARIQLLEQAHVLQRDDGLVGEGLRQLDLPVRERRAPGEGDRADGRGLTDHRDSHDAAEAGGPRNRRRVGEAAVRLEIGDVYRPLLEDGKTTCEVPREGLRIRPPAVIDRLRRKL